MTKYVTFVALFLLLSYGGFGQKMLTGKVLDAETNLPIQGATVTLQGSVNRATTTDIQGKFNLRADANVSAIVVTVDEYVPLKIKLLPNTQNLILLITPANEDANEARSVGFVEKTLPKSLVNSEKTTIFYGKK